MLWNFTNFSTFLELRRAFSRSHLNSHQIQDIPRQSCGLNFRLISSSPFYSSSGASNGSGSSSDSDNDSDDEGLGEPIALSSQEQEAFEELKKDGKLKGIELSTMEWAMRVNDGIEAMEQDITEAFMRGSGRGGQAVSKTNNCVQLKHIPTGIVVKCHDGRSLAQNRKIARKTLRDKLDHMINGVNSKIGKEIAKKRNQKAKRRRKVIKKFFKAKRDMEPS
eukprot:CAMPEP_0182449924 /NCGR_PEP_ID=MMETSP1172-20130603/37622_1 /TAXON_ID=708627 /ORGANISM="Timspurckia oligopyrenoides, Strain CCMP3278" /LENGTH=220 /DNA_ID=CAMNT_0024647347 /DNA_START=48 /DNA_END=707 /DNA_ORIENTATION=+